MDAVYICVDSGTSMVKAVALDSTGKLLASAAIPNEFANLPGGGAEQNLQTTWTSAAKVIAEVASQVDNIASRITAIGVTGQGDGTWLIDSKGEPVGDGLIWLDVRAADVVRAAEDSGVRATLYQHTGCGLNACNQSAQLVWLKANEPDRVAKADCAMHCKDWLYYKLTNERVTDISEALFTFGDLRTRDYADEIFAALELGDCRRLMPPLVDGAVVQHKLTTEAAALVGLPAGTPVSLGNVDVVCSAVGGGVFAPEAKVGVSIIGSTGMHVRYIPSLDELELPEEASGYTMVASGFPAGVLRMQSNMSATLNIDWLVKVFGEISGYFGTQPSDTEVLAKLDEIAANPSAVVFHPYIQAGERGPFFNPDALASFSGIDFATSAADLCRAVFEGLANAARHCYSATGAIPAELRLIGGASRSKVMCQTLANTLNAKVRLNQAPEASALGVMLIAAVASGQFPDMTTAVRDCVDPQLSDALAPQAVLRDFADKSYAAYVAGAEAAPPVWAALTATRQAKPS